MAWCGVWARMGDALATDVSSEVGRQLYTRRANDVGTGRPAYVAQDRIIASATDDLYRGFSSIFDVLMQTSQSVNDAIVTPGVDSEEEEDDEDIGPPAQGPPNFDPAILDMDIQPRNRAWDRKEGPVKVERGMNRGLEMVEEEEDEDDEDEEDEEDDDEEEEEDDDEDDDDLDRGFDEVLPEEDPGSTDD
ncbi:nucleolin-like [Macrosteles quadrilineatus]|uniref:nucleolin-like n=1 Tax=Macrosteles quadrilineatus TaxID=74068 RepID=UPI0023E27674|nr:nucleolin-like [Macrosteles quadrilineatus]